jgi:Ca-activated chloride channel family protein
VAQQPTQARLLRPCTPGLALALLLSVLLVVAVQWPDNLLQRLLRKPRFLQPHPEWRQRLKRLRLRRRR